IQELKTSDKGSQRFFLQDGIRLGMDGADNVYQFPFEDDVEIFEGSPFTALVYPKSSKGRIVSFFNNKLTLEFEEDFGEEIDSCRIEIDNTALLEALLDKLKELEEGKLPAFNTALADA